jgi:hypothetical protein
MFVYVVHIFDAKCNRELFMSPVVLEVLFQYLLYFDICFNCLLTCQYLLLFAFVSVAI